MKYGVKWLGNVRRHASDLSSSLKFKKISRRVDKFVSQHLSGAGSSPADSVGRDLNYQKLNYQYLTTSVAVVLGVR